jgi:2-phospho-L-lactate guanylyltransferase
VVDDPGSLSASAAAGRAWARAGDFARVAVVHGDLPFITSLDAVLVGDPATSAAVVPCHRGDGTPVLVVPAGSPFEFAYGPGSFARHCEEARRHGLTLHVPDDPTLRFDVDVADDLDAMRAGRIPHR